MTAPLRKAHFIVWILLAVIGALIFATGLLARRSTTPINSSFRWESVR